MTELRRVDVNLIVMLDAVLGEKNLTRAAERLGMTQPGVSGGLARLRQQFDDPILVRVGRGFELTDKAEQLRPLVRAAVAEISRTLQLSPRFDPGTSTRTFMISASDYVLSQLTAPLLRLISQEAPGTHVEFDALAVGAAVDVTELLRRDVIVVGTGRGVPGKRQALFTDRFVCIADAANPRLRNGRMSLTDLADLRHAVSGLGGLVQTHVDEMLAAAGIAPRVGLSVQGFLPLPFAVSGTQMVAFLPERLAYQYRDQLGLIIVETPLPSTTLVEAAYWHPSKTSDPALVWLVALLRKASELLEFGEVQAELSR